MLVLTRKLQQTIVINNDVTITILRVGNRVQVGIKAPEDVTIRRGELVSSQENDEVDSKASTAK